jgi:hypothetical protein
MFHSPGILSRRAFAFAAGWAIVDARGKGEWIVTKTHEIAAIPGDEGPSAPWARRQSGASLRTFPTICG